MGSIIANSEVNINCNIIEMIKQYLVFALFINMVILKPAPRENYIVKLEDGSSVLLTLESQEVDTSEKVSGKMKVKSEKDTKPLNQVIEVQVENEEDKHSAKKDEKIKGDDYEAEDVTYPTPTDGDWGDLKAKVH